MIRILYSMDVYKSVLPVNDLILGLTKDRFTKKELGRMLGRALSSEWMYSNESFHSSTLLLCTRRYSEQITTDIERDLGVLFDTATGRDIDTSFSDLRYFSNSQYTYNKSIEAALGEGLAGYLIQHEGYNPLARPLNTIPDVLMQKDNTIALVEAKATVEGNIYTPMRKAAIEILDLMAKVPYLLRRNYVGFVVGIEIVRSNYFVGHILELSP